VTRDIDLETIPVYARAGAIVPVGPTRQYAAEPSDEPVTLQVYPGADGRFSWYEDDGMSFRYRQGEFTRLECAWSDGPRTLTLTQAEGSRTSHAKKVNVRAMDNGKILPAILTGRSTVIQL
jgi:alpha-glucosidase/alpha-D-xyloside xylohydrolase